MSESVYCCIRVNRLINFLIYRETLIGAYKQTYIHLYMILSFSKICILIVRIGSFEIYDINDIISTNLEETRKKKNYFVFLNKNRKNKPFFPRFLIKYKSFVYILFQLLKQTLYYINN